MFLIFVADGRRCKAERIPWALITLTSVFLLLSPEDACDVSRLGDEVFRALLAAWLENIFRLTMELALPDVCEELLISQCSRILRPICYILVFYVAS